MSKAKMPSKASAKKMAMKKVTVKKVAVKPVKMTVAPLGMSTVKAKSTVKSTASKSPVKMAMKSSKKMMSSKKAVRKAVVTVQTVARKLPADMAKVVHEKEMTLVKALRNKASGAMKSLAHLIMKGANKVKSGFTLIELLIVVSIIALLSVALLPNIGGAMAKARDASRKNDIASIVKTIEEYNMNNGSYPTGRFCLDADSAAGPKDDLRDLMRGKKFPEAPSAPGVGALTGSGCAANEYFYCQLTTAGNYLVGVRMDVADVGRGYRASGTDLGVGNCDTAADAADAVVAGDVYISVQ